MKPALVAALALALAPTAPTAGGGFEACLATRGDQVVAAQDADRAMVPASVVKLVVAAAAVHHLGTEFRVVTELRATAPPRGGVVTGDLVLVAAGDPTWSARFFPEDPRAPLRALAASLRERGVRRVEGDLVVDLSAFPGRPFPPSRAIGEMAYGWAAPTSGVAIDDNVVTLDIAPGHRVGAPASARLVGAGGPRLDNHMTTAPRERHDRGTVDVLPAWRGPTLHLRGEYPVSEPPYRMEVAVPDPVEHAGRALVAALAEAGIAVAGEVVASADPVVAPTRLGVVRSPPLTELLPPILGDSRNWHAEMLLRLLARAATGTGRSDDGLDLLVDFLEEAVGVEAGSVHLDDASGISPYDLVTPRSIVRLLRFVLAQPWRDVYLDALARPGTGSLAGWPRLPPSLRAKTGTGRHTLGLAGVVAAPGDTEPLVFACLSNHRADDRPAQRRELATRVRRWATARDRAP